MDGMEPLSKMSLHSSGICCVIFSYLFTIHVKSLPREKKVIKKSFPRPEISRMGQQGKVGDLQVRKRGKAWRFSIKQQPYWFSVARAWCA